MNVKPFTGLLMQWHREKNTRQMPWKGEKDPYKVWLSEVLLQQTRVEQGLSYYLKFIERYPTIQQLADANDQDVFKLWEGLGYYNRCRNLLFTAREIVQKYLGIFPSEYETILSLKGIGTYTASAISSFCFNLPHAVVDGNVFRVLSRVFGISLPSDSNEGKFFFHELAAKALHKKEPALYNQAIMDFGAVVCKPMLPLCYSCPLNKICKAHKKNIVNELPVKLKATLKQTRWLSYFIFEAKGKVLLHLRSEKDIWQGLYEFYLIETRANPNWDKNILINYLHDELDIDDCTIKGFYSAKSQQLTHRNIHGWFIHVQLNAVPAGFKSKYCKWVNIQEVKQLPFPKFINQFIGHRQNTLQF